MDDDFILFPWDGDDELALGARPLLAGKLIADLKPRLAAGASDINRHNVHNQLAPPAKMSETDRGNLRGSPEAAHRCLAKTRANGRRRHLLD
jgi:hypothetical protein